MSLLEAGPPVADVRCDMCGLHLDPRSVRYLFVNWGWRGRSSLLSKDARDHDVRLTLCGPHGDRMVDVLERYQLAQKRGGRCDRGTGLDREALPITYDG
jgi:hypothetical protein